MDQCARCEGRGGEVPDYSRFLAPALMGFPLICLAIFLGSCLTIPRTQSWSPWSPSQGFLWTCLVLGVLGWVLTLHPQQILGFRQWILTFHPQGFLGFLGSTLRNLPLGFLGLILLIMVNNLLRGDGSRPRTPNWTYYPSYPTHYPWRPRLGWPRYAYTTPCPTYYPSYSSYYPSYSSYYPSYSSYYPYYPSYSWRPGLGWSSIGFWY